jgi:hypothetical protein
VQQLPIPGLLVVWRTAANTANLLFCGVHHTTWADVVVPPRAEPEVLQASPGGGAVDPEGVVMDPSLMNPTPWSHVVTLNMFGDMPRPRPTVDTSELQAAGLMRRIDSLPNSPIGVVVRACMCVCTVHRLVLSLVPTTFVP